MNNDEKCSCSKYLEKNTELKLNFSNETYSIYGNLNNGEKIILKYFGKLIPSEDSGLNETKIFLNYGYGNLWANKDIKEMQLCSHSENNCYCIDLELINPENLFFCFMDNNNNWDLNDNSSYMITVDIAPTTLIKKASEYICLEDEYISFTDKLFKKLSKKLINFFMKIGKLFEKRVKE